MPVSSRPSLSNSIQRRQTSRQVGFVSSAWNNLKSIGHSHVQVEYCQIASYRIFWSHAVEKFIPSQSCFASPRLDTFCLAFPCYSLTSSKYATATMNPIPNENPTHSNEIWTSDDFSLMTEGSIPTVAIYRNPPDVVANSIFSRVSFFCAYNPKNVPRNAAIAVTNWALIASHLLKIKYLIDEESDSVILFFNS